MSGVGGRPQPGVELDLELVQGDFRLRVEARIGSAAAVLGSSGAGKTTLLEAVAGLRRAEGRAVLGGRVLQDTVRGIYLPPERRGLGYVPQAGALFDHLSVRRNLLFARRRLPPRACEEIVEILDLEPLLDRYPRHLSGGETRRVALGRALLGEPRLLLLDEPTAGLDPPRARKVLGYLSAVREQLSIPLLLVTHHQEEALALASELVVLEGGRVVASGPAKEVRRRLLGLPERGEGGEERTENVVRGRVLRHDEEGGVTVVAIPGEIEITLRSMPEIPAGSRLTLALEAEELLVATAPPEGLSARNVFSGEVDELTPSGTSVYVRAGDWLARLTPAAVADLGLAPGRRIWLVAKTHSWRLVAAEGP